MRLRDTLDLPVADPPVADPPVADPPVAAPPVAAPVPPRGGTARAAGSRRPLAVAALLLAAAVGGAATGVVLAGTGAPAGQPSAAAPAVITPASVTSFDPSGGSGFRQAGSSWRTQTYRSAAFGNLKSGVGLLIDVGASREVTSVTLDLATPGLAVELRAAGEAAGDLDGFQVVDSAEPAAGTVTLSAQDAGARRFWLVWVTRLAPVDGGFGARVGTPVLSGP